AKYTPGVGWAALTGSGTDGGVNALAVLGGDLYAGGNFTNAGEVPGTAYIAKYTPGTGWAAFIGGATDGPIYALAVLGGDLYVGGQFTTAGGVGSVGNIARYRPGRGWAGLTGGGASSGSISLFASALAVLGNELYVGGNFTTAGGASGVG